MQGLERVRDRLMDFNFAIAFISGIFGGLLFRLILEYFERPAQEIKSENTNDTGNSLLSQYRYAIVRVYEDKDDDGFTIITIKPISMCEYEEEAVNGAREQRKYEREVVMSNHTCDLKDYWKTDNIRAIKIYEAD